VSNVLKSGLNEKLARPAIFRQAKSLPTNTDSFADDVDISQD
jgi:hypothetical protein